MASLAFGSSLDSTQEIVKTIQTAPRGGARVRLLPPVHLLRSAALSYPTHFLQTDLIASAPLFLLLPTTTEQSERRRRARHQQK